jgi:hypothetical protein
VRRGLLPSYRHVLVYFCRKCLPGLIGFRSRPDRFIDRRLAEDADCVVACIGARASCCGAPTKKVRAERLASSSHPLDSAQPTVRLVAEHVAPQGSSGACGDPGTSRVAAFAKGHHLLGCSFALTGPRSHQVSSDDGHRDVFPHGIASLPREMGPPGLEPGTKGFA